MTLGQKTQMFRGAAWACALPVSLGLIILLFVLIDPNELSLILLLPISLCFIFATPLTTWLACRSLKRRDDAKYLSRWGSSFRAFFGYASLVQILTAGLYTAGFLIWASAFFGSELETEVLTILGIALYLNFLIWVVVILPLSLLCATIFWRVTKFPEDTSVF